jgi:hypothetical protein
LEKKDRPKSSLNRYYFSQSQNLIKVNIFVPYPSNAFRLECPESMSIKELKTKIWEEHPTHPSVKEQKLLFLGRFLSDNATLKSSLSNVHKIDGFNICLCPIADYNKGESRPSEHTYEDGVKRQRKGASSVRQVLLPQQPRIALINSYFFFAFCSFCSGLLAYVIIIKNFR